MILVVWFLQGSVGPSGSRGAVGSEGAKVSGRYIILQQNLKFKNTDIGFFRRLTLLQLIKSNTKVCRSTRYTVFACLFVRLLTDFLIKCWKFLKFLYFKLHFFSPSPPLIYIFWIHARRSLTTGANYVHRLWHSKLVGILSCSVVVFFQSLNFFIFLSVKICFSFVLEY